MGIAGTPERVGRWGSVALALLGAKMVCLAAGSMAAWLWPDFEAERAERISEVCFPEGWSRTPHGKVGRHLATWDAEHYLYLSEVGHGPSARSHAFFPLWPLTTRSVGELTGFSHSIVGLALANLFSLAGWVLFHRTAARRFGDRVADASLALLVVFPGSLFYRFNYSESLFFLWVMALWHGLERRRYGLAWAAAFLVINAVLHGFCYGDS